MAIFNVVVLASLLLVLWTQPAAGCKSQRGLVALIEAETCDKKKNEICEVCGTRQQIKIIVNNKFQEPHFEIKMTVSDIPEQKLFSFFEKGAAATDGMRFSTMYYGPTLGYMLTGVNGVMGTTESKTFWQILHHPSGIPLNVGASSYIPIPGETIMFNFTTWANY